MLRSGSLAVAVAVVVHLAWPGPSRARHRRARAPAGYVIPGEFEPQEQLIIPWNPSYSELITQVAARATHELDVVIAADPQELDEVRWHLEDARVDLAAVDILEIPLESIWMRDYGPIVLRRGDGARRMMDPSYPYRYHDDEAPQELAKRLWGTSAVRVPLIIEAGNLLSNGRGVCVATSQAIANDYFRYSRRHVQRILRRHLGCQRLVVLPAIPGERTGHVDMFVALTGANSALVGQYRRRTNPKGARALDRAAYRLRKVGFRVTRIPMPEVKKGVYRTYTNLLILNRTVLVPVYQQDRRWERRALTVLRSAFPGRHIVPIVSDELIEVEGALHCIGMNVPR
jgi:agmatine deiminase